MGQVLMDLAYFERRLSEEVARARRRDNVFSVVVFTSEPEEGELPDVACARGSSKILTGVRETDSVCRISDDSLAVLLIDADGDGSRSAALRLLERLGADLGRWRVRVLDYPTFPHIFHELGLAAA
jgi:hypothetical protein